MLVWCLSDAPHNCFLAVLCPMCTHFVHVMTLSLIALEAAGGVVESDVQCVVKQC